MSHGAHHHRQPIGSECQPVASDQTVAAGVIPIRGSGRLALAGSAVGPGRAQAGSVPRHDYPLVPRHSAAALSWAAL